MSGRLEELLIEVNRLYFALEKRRPYTIREKGTMFNRRYELVFRGVVAEGQHTRVVETTRMKGSLKQTLIYLMAEIDNKNQELKKKYEKINSDTENDMHSHSFC